MNETIIAFLSFFSFIFLIIQIKLIKRLRYLRKKSERIMGDILFSAGAACCVIAEVGLACGEAAEAASRKERKKEEEIKDPFSKEKPKPRKRIFAKRKHRQLSKEEKERDKILKIIRKQEKTDLSWISNKTSVPMKRVQEIINEESDFIIDDNYIVNRKSMVKEEQAYLWEKIREQHKKEREDKIARGICPECGNTFGLGTEKCPACGVILK